MIHKTDFSEDVLKQSRKGYLKATYVVIALVLLYLVVLAAGLLPSPVAHHDGHSDEAAVVEGADHAPAEGVHEET